MHPKRSMLALVLIVLAFTAAHVVAKEFGDWSEPTNLGGAVNSVFFEAAPAISKNGLSLYFHSDRPGLGGPNDIYVSQRSSKTAAWRPAVLVGLRISTIFNLSYAPWRVRV